MKSDITRSTFKRDKHYSGVRMQQGRVQLDADWNEQVDLNAYRLETGTTDMVGLSGAPENHAGFKIDIDPVTRQPKILAAKIRNEKDEEVTILGRYYVDGILCEIEKDIPFTNQPDYPAAALPQPTPDNLGFHLAYLDVWQHHLTIVDDPSLREVALDVTDTTTRTKTVCQVKLLKMKDPAIGITNLCGQKDEWEKLTAERNARLAAHAVPLSTTAGTPSIAASQDDSRSVANQLYRVEIHAPGKTGSAAFKWSRDNGSVVARIKEISNNTIIVFEAPRDDLLAFQPGNWVEVLDEVHELRDGRGILVRLTSQTEGTTLVFDPNTATAPLPNEVGKGKWKVRRWDHVTESDQAATIPTQAFWIPLEDGVEVQFDAGGQYEIGDYWLIPARAITRNVDWPVDQDGNPSFEQRHGIKHHYSRLAILQLQASGWRLDHDCRRIFSPLVDQLNVFYISGDGQETIPGKILAKPLQVGVTNGQRRVAGAPIKFEILPNGQGTLHLSADPNSPAFKTLIVETGTEDDGELEGIAECFWKLDDTNRSQQVKATLRDALDQPVHLPVRFNANLSRASEIAIYTVPACGEAAGAPPSVQSLFRKTIVDDSVTPPKLLWPDLDQDGTATVEDALDALLCHLDANRLPLDSRHEPPDSLCAHDLYPPATTKTIGDAFRALCNIMAKHVGFETPADCGTRQITVQALLQTALAGKWPDFDGDGRVTVKDILNALLCELDADRLPFQHQCKNDLYPASMKSVGDALNTLCENSVTPSGTIAGTFGTLLNPDPEMETKPVVEFTGAEFDKFRIPQVIPTTPKTPPPPPPRTPPNKLSWSYQVAKTGDQEMKYYFNIKKDQPGILGYEIRFVKYNG